MTTEQPRTNVEKFFALGHNPLNRAQRRAFERDFRLARKKDARTQAVKASRAESRNP